MNFKSYKTLTSARAAIKKAGLGAMNVRYDDVTGKFAGAKNIQPVVICELLVDVNEVQNRGFRAELCNLQVKLPHERWPICIYHSGDWAAYYHATDEEQDAWNEYANQAARDFNDNPSLDSYDSTSTYPGRDRDGNTTKWCPPIYFPEFIQKWRLRHAR